jgi:hypothetical protein
MTPEEDPAFNYFHAELFSCIPPEPQKFSEFNGPFASQDSRRRGVTLQVGNN